MQDSRKTKPQLVAELEGLRAELRRHIDAETDAARAEEALWQAQVALLALLNNLPGMAYRTAFDAAHPGGRVEFVSNGCLKATGYPASVYVGDPAFYRGKVVHPDDRERVRREIAAAQANRAPFSLTYRIVAKDGSVRWLDEHGTITSGPNGELAAREGFISDVTERVAHIEELRRQHTELEKMTRALEQAGELIVIGDATGAIQHVNRAFERITGYTRAEVIGHSLLEAAGAREERDQVRRIRLTLGRGEVWRGRYACHRKDGSRLELECTCSPIFSPDGHYEGYVAVQRAAGEPQDPPQGNDGV